MKITKVTKKDFADWVELGALFWARHPKEKSEKELTRILASQNEVSFMCRNDEGQGVGFIYVAIRSDYVEGSSTSPIGYLEGIYIKEAYRKQGIAKMLFKEAEKWFKNKNVSEVGSDTGTDNMASRIFHESLGFKKGETLVHYLKVL